MSMKIAIACLFILSIPICAHAYVGPGLGLGALGVILGIFFSILLAVVGIVWYPVKRLIRKFKKEKP